MGTVKCIGILTSGGDAPGMNAAIRAVTRAAIYNGLQVKGIYRGYKGLVTGEIKEFKSQNVSNIIQLGGTILKTARCKEFTTPEGRQLAYDNMKKEGIDALVVIGGDGSLTGARIFAQEFDIPCIGLPGTIDNDLYGTDHCPGYASAAKYIATILKEVIRDSSVYDIRSVTVAEIMGRHAGWLAGAACLAGGDDCDGPDLILLPEVPFEPDKFLAKVDELQRRKSNVIIAASEGVKNRDGVFLCDLVSTAGQLDAFGHKAILSGTSRYLADLIHVRLGCKTRAIEFSTLQRCASHLASRTDITEAYQVGGASVEAAYRGETGKMCAIRRISDMPYRTETEMVDVQKVANLEKRVPDDWISPDGMHVTEAFHHYARPLIQAELTPIYIDGVPRHLHLH